jgi:hypothetical protein
MYDSRAKREAAAAAAAPIEIFGDTAEAVPFQD